MTEAQAAIYGKAPLYAVLFSSSLDASTPYTPYVTVPKGTDGIFGIDAPVTIPHGLSREMAAALPGLWYCMHLPNIFPQLVDMPIAALKNGQSLSLEHHFFFAPIQIFNRTYIRAWPPWVIPALAVCPDDLIGEVRENAKNLDFPLLAAPFSELSDVSLTEHWHAIHELFVPDFAYLGYEPKLTRRLDLSPTSLPARWLARQVVHEPEEDINEDLVQLIHKTQSYQLALARAVQLERDEQVDSNSSGEASKKTVKERVQLRFPVTLALPGVAAAYSRKTFAASIRSRIEPLSSTDDQDTWSPDMYHRRDSMVERSTIELLATHRAIAQTGMGLLLPSVPREAFIALAEIERHFTGTPSGPVVSRLLARLNEAASSIWTDALVETVIGASTLTIFSNFPLGLLVYPGDSSPLSTRLPIAYHPLNPLSQAMQRELTYVPGVDLSEGFSVLVAECIPPTDPVGAISRAGWSAGKEFIQEGRYPITFDVVETLSISDLRAAIEEKSPAIIVISAHGVYRPKSNLAGLAVGTEICLGPELGDLPPVVILSACHVAPRGAGAVSITDLVLRQGALAVLGTQVPVDVGHNAILITRLFLYLAETLANREGYSTLLEAWHHVQRSNAINDVLYGNSQLRKWGLGSKTDGSWVLGDFMESRSAGKIRRGHVYSDTERLLGEMADEQGIGEKVRNWFRRPGYVPESLFYVFAGMPERVYLRHPG